MSKQAHIPFNRPYVAPDTLKYVEEALKSNHQQGGGFLNSKATELVKKISGGGETFLTASCTQALEMATMLLDLKPGDEVIMPSFTFTSAATALANYGVIPVFVDIEPTHLNIDPNKVRDAITPRTKAISIVNYAGNACDFAALDEIAKEFGLLKIEDNAHGFGVSSNGRKLGTWGDVATLSFHATKNIQCGEGGALTVNNPEYVDRAHILQEKGTNRRMFEKGQVLKYRWVDKGGSFLISEVTSAMLLAQLENYNSIQESRRKTFNWYAKIFEELNINNNLKTISFDAVDASHIFWILLTGENREVFIKQMSSFNIQVTSHYEALHASPAGGELSKCFGNLKHTNKVVSNIVRLPIWAGMTLFDLEYIKTSLEKSFKKMGII